MNVKRLTPPLLIALAVSSVCTLALARKMKQPGTRQVAMVPYVVATHAMPAGDLLKADSVQIAQWPADHPLLGAFAKPTDVVGRALLYPIDANQPLTDKLVSAPGAGSGLAARIPDGMRAIALKSDEVMGVAGFLGPGAHIDVLVTYHLNNSPDARTATVLQNSEVLAAGQQVQPDPQGKPATVSVVTLLLSPVDAERAVLASSQGTIHFIMRSGSDQGSTKGGGVTMAQLADPNAPMVTESAVTAPAPARLTTPVGLPHLMHQSTVELYSGDKQSTATFTDGTR
ncbi:MAG: Flp pilus assembly protein CpaB [Janthinobacterium lividum]